MSNISTKKNRACCRSVQHIKQTEQGALHLFLTYQSMSNIINEPINVSINDEQTVTTFYETMTARTLFKSNQKHNASTNRNISFSSRVLANNFFLQGLWRRTNRNDSRTNIVLFYFFTLSSSDMIEFTF